MWNDWDSASQDSLVQRRTFFCSLILALLQRIVFWIQPWKHLMITVYSQNWHAACETVNVFFFIRTIWLSNAGEKTHRTHCNTTVNIHTHCGNRMIISQEITGERFMIYCETLQPVQRFPFYISILLNTFYQFCNAIKLPFPIIIISLKFGKFDLCIQMSCLIDYKSFIAI